MKRHQLTLTDQELGLLMEALALAASRREAQGNYVRHGRNQVKAAKMRDLRARLYDLQHADEAAA